jgi:hypothetical protein
MRIDFKRAQLATLRWAALLAFGLRTGPALAQQQLRIPDNVGQLNGCWHSQTGELPVVSSTTNERVGTSRNCFCFKSDGRGSARIIYTTNTKKKAGSQEQKVCEGKLTASITSRSLTFQYEGNLRCTDGGRFATKGPVTWICTGDASRAAMCEQQPPYGTLREKFIKVDDKYCGWSSR